MEPTEFCKMKHGYCSCEGREVVCAQVLRLSSDPHAIESARQEARDAQMKKESRYLRDEMPWYDMPLPMMEEIKRAMLTPPPVDDIMRIVMTPSGPPKTAVAELMKRYIGVEPKFDFSLQEAVEIDYSAIEKKMLADFRETRPLPGPSPRERRLGSSDKPYIRFMDDPMTGRRSV